MMKNTIQRVFAGRSIAKAKKTDKNADEKTLIILTITLPCSIISLFFPCILRDNSATLWLRESEIVLDISLGMNQ